jgi:hypothetical protein
LASSLQKLQLTYDHVQDRLVLSFLTSDFAEYRFWITRKMVSALFEILQKLQEALLKTVAEKNKEAQKASQQIQHEATQRLAEKLGTRMTLKPLGDEPLLLYKVMAKPLEKNQVFFHLEDQIGRNIEFGADANLVTGLIQLIEKTLPQTDWNLLQKNMPLNKDQG